MKKSLVLSILACSLYNYANIGPQGFGAFKNNYFVETGTFGGSGIKLALKAGFSYVRSIEAVKSLYDAAVARFRNDSRVKIWFGDSATDLWDMIKDINEPITFWLDAHIFPPRADGGKNCPLMEELEQIKQHSIKTHTILIDDMHCAGTAAFDGLTIEDLIAKLLEINPEYQITYVPGGDDGEYPHNVMVASVLL